MALKKQTPNASVHHSLKAAKIKWILLTSSFCAEVHSPFYTDVKMARSLRTYYRNSATMCSTQLFFLVPCDFSIWYLSLHIEMNMRYVYTHGYIRHTNRYMLLFSRRLPYERVIIHYCFEQYLEKYQRDCYMWMRMKCKCALVVSSIVTPKPTPTTATAIEAAAASSAAVAEKK